MSTNMHLLTVSPLSPSIEIFDKSLHGYLAKSLKFKLTLNLICYPALIETYSSECLGVRQQGTQLYVHQVDILRLMHSVVTSGYVTPPRK